MLVGQNSIFKGIQQEVLIKDSVVAKRMTLEKFILKIRKPEFRARLNIKCVDNDYILYKCDLSKAASVYYNLLKTKKINKDILFDWFETGDAIATQLEVDVYNFRKFVNNHLSDLHMIEKNNETKQLRMRVSDLPLLKVKLRELGYLFPDETTMEIIGLKRILEYTGTSIEYKTFVQKNYKELGLHLVYVDKNVSGNNLLLEKHNKSFFIRKLRELLNLEDIGFWLETNKSIEQATGMSIAIIKKHRNLVPKIEYRFKYDENKIRVHSSYICTLERIVKAAEEKEKNKIPVEESKTDKSNDNKTVLLKGLNELADFYSVNLEEMRYVLDNCQYLRNSLPTAYQKDMYLYFKKPLSEDISYNYLKLMLKLTLYNYRLDKVFINGSERVDIEDLCYIFMDTSTVFKNKIKKLKPRNRKFTKDIVEEINFELQKEGYYGKKIKK